MGNVGNQKQASQGITYVQAYTTRSEVDTLVSMTKQALNNAQLFLYVVFCFKEGVKHDLSDEQSMLTHNIFV